MAEVEFKDFTFDINGGFIYYNDIIDMKNDGFNTVMVGRGIMWNIFWL